MKENDFEITILQAAQSGNVIYMEQRRESDFHVRDKNGWKPLHYAAASGHLDAVKLIVEITKGTSKGMQLNEPVLGGLTALHLAAQQGHLSVVEYLEDQGAYLYSIDHKGYTPLHLASKENHFEVVSFLIEKGTEPEVEGKSGVTPLFLAAEKGSDAAMQALLESGANPDNSGFSDRGPLYAALKSGNIEAVKLLVEKGANVNGSDKMPKITPLHKAIKYQFILAIELLVKHGADLYKEGYYEGSPMSYAAKYPPCEGFFKLLHEWGVKIPVDLFSDKLEDPSFGTQFKAAADEIAEIYIGELSLTGAEETESFV